MRLFAKNRAARLTEKQEVLVGRIAGRLTLVQRRMADWLNGKTSGLNARAWLSLLIIFIVSFGAYCLSLLISAFN